MGQTGTFYDLDNLNDAKTLIGESFSYDEGIKNNTFNCSLLYLCTNEDREKFTICALSIISSEINEVIEKTLKLGVNESFIDKIKFY